MNTTERVGESVAIVDIETCMLFFVYRNMDCCAAAWACVDGFTVCSTCDTIFIGVSASDNEVVLE